MIDFEEVCKKETPSIVVVAGDVNSTIACALVAKKLSIPVGHVEAGLRSFDMEMPEEVNRILCDHISTLLFCPTQTSVNNLKEEGITRGVEYVGDIMYDGILYYKEKANSTILDYLCIEPSNYILATVHRSRKHRQSDSIKSHLPHLGRYSSF